MNGPDKNAGLGEFASPNPRKCRWQDRWFKEFLSTIATNRERQAQKTKETGGRWLRNDRGPRDSEPANIRWTQDAVIEGKSTNVKRRIVAIVVGKK